MKTNKIVMSIGYGRLHLIESAKRISDRGINVSLVCGWVPKNAKSWLVKLCSRLVGRDLSFGFAKRQINHPHINVCSCPTVDFLDQFVRLSIHKLHLGKFQPKASELMWRLFGFNSRKFLSNDTQIFHVRTGAGQGGAIAKAKKLGIKVVADHSAAHPAFTEKSLKQVCIENGENLDIQMNVFWKNVVKDSEDADVIQVNSFFVRDTFIQNGFNPDKIKVIYLGVREDFQSLRLNNNRKVKEGGLKLLFTGAICFRKGVGYLFDAIKILSEKKIDVSLDAYGSTSMAGKIFEPYRDSDLPIHLCGLVPQDDLKNALATSDIYVYPSLTDGCAQSGMEAMTAGLCVIATCESGLPITDGETGYIVPSKDAKAIADKIMWLNDHPEEIERVGRNAAKMMRENYTWDKYAENCQKMYDELLGEN